jgi:hypothetical protein
MRLGCKDMPQSGSIPPKWLFALVLLPVVFAVVPAFGRTGAFGEPLESWQLASWGCAIALTVLFSWPVALGITYARAGRRLSVPTAILICSMVVMVNGFLSFVGYWGALMFRW